MFVRDIPIAGDIISRSIGERLGVDLPTAESRKLDLIEKPLDSAKGSESDDDKMVGMTGNLGKFAAQEGYDYLSGAHEDITIGGDGQVVEAEPDPMPLEPERPDHVVELKPEFDPHETSQMDYSGNAPQGGGAAQIIKPSGLIDHESELYAVLDDALRELVHEVQDTVKYYVSKRIVPKVDRVIVTGGSSLVPELPEYLSDTLGQTCEFWNPLLDVDIEAVSSKVPVEILEEVGPAMAVALGLAMRSA